MQRPVIGVVPLYDELKESLWMLPGYMDAVEQAGGIPVMMPLTTDEQIIERLSEMYDGFLFTGGQDVDPRLYGEEPLPECGTVCTERDRMEQILLDRVLCLDKPILGICRGIQLINALLGGTLYQDLPAQFESSVEHHQTPPYDRPVHKVRLLEDTPLRDLLQTEELAVNSYHHQAVRILSPQLKTMAVSEDGLTEAVYREESRFLWAVQWHPEFSFRTDSASAEIVKAFVNSCGEAGK